MKSRLCLLAVLLFFCSWLRAYPGTDTPGPKRLYLIDIEAKRTSGAGPLNVVKGDVLQYFLVTALEKDDSVRTLKVEIDGDALALVGVVETPGRSGEPIDKTKKTISGMIRAVKEGDATDKITPILEDGRNRKSYSVTFRVLAKPKGVPPAK